MPSDLESLLNRHLPALRAFVRLRCDPAVRARESASDVVQSVCRELLQNGQKVGDGGDAAFRCWSFTKALDKVRDHYRYHHARKRDVRAEQRASSGTHDLVYASAYATVVTPSEVAIAREEAERIERAFDELPEQYREIITLSRLAGLGHAEIAEHLDVSEKTVSNAIYRGLRRLSWILSDDSGEEAG